VAMTTVYKLTLSSNSVPVFQYFTQASAQKLMAEMVTLANTAPQTFTLSSFQADLSSVDLTKFLDAGGMLVGPVQIS
jgi:hypothetical protein